MQTPKKSPDHTLLCPPLIDENALNPKPRTVNPEVDPTSSTGCIHFN